MEANDMPKAAGLLLLASAAPRERGGGPLPPPPPGEWRQLLGFAAKALLLLPLRQAEAALVYVQVRGREWLTHACCHHKHGSSCVACMQVHLGSSATAAVYPHTHGTTHP